MQQVHINENFAKLAEALYIADRKAREAVEMRAQLEKKLAQKEKEKKEDHLRQLAQKAREERAGLKSAALGSYMNFTCIKSFFLFHFIQLKFRFIYTIV